jgi:hypothetical protein
VTGAACAFVDALDLARSFALALALARGCLSSAFIFGMNGLTGLSDPTPKSLMEMDIDLGNLRFTFSSFQHEL